MRENESGRRNRKRWCSNGTTWGGSDGGRELSCSHEGLRRRLRTESLLVSVCLGDVVDHRRRSFIWRKDVEWPHSGVLSRSESDPRVL